MVSGASPSTWKFYSAVHNVIGALPANNDDLVEESMVVNGEVPTYVVYSTYDVPIPFIAILLISPRQPK